MAKIPGTYSNRGRQPEHEVIVMPEEYWNGRIPITSKPSDEALGYLKLPENLNGLKLLEVGAGSSDLTEELSSRGADAYALDPGYSDPDQLVARARAHNNSAGFNDTQKAARESTVIRFQLALDRNPDHYIAGSVLELPFPDETFDIVLSVDTMTIYFALEHAKLLKAITECLRVTKPGGFVQLFPFQSKRVGFNEEIDTIRLQNEAGVMNELHGSSAVAQIELFDPLAPRQDIGIILEKAA